LPKVDDELNENEPFGTIEAVKTVSDMLSPLSGKVMEVNESLNDEPETINSDPYEKGWIVKIEFQIKTN